MTADGAVSEHIAVANWRIAEALVAAVGDCGVQDFVVSPGSRSGPLAVAAVSNPQVRVHVVLDERSAAFRALGLTKASGKPCALICTSGSAPAHYFPAVIEAWHACLPMVILSSDRPPELRHCHAGQTVDQTHFYGSHVRMYAELPVPGADWPGKGSRGLRQLVQICRRAVGTAVGPVAGAVQINVPLREPLLPQSGAQALAGESNSFPRLGPLPVLQSTSDELVVLPSRTLILSGALPGGLAPALAEELVQMSNSAGLPLLADGASPLRHWADRLPLLVTQYDRLARSQLDSALRPQGLLCLGEPPLSKAFRAWLAELDIPAWQIGPGKPDMNPCFARMEYLGTGWPRGLQAVPAAPEFSDAWREANLEASATQQAALTQPHEFFEGDLWNALPDLLDEGTAVLIANSLAIRDAEWFMPASTKRLRVFSQRGANGIDGTVSIARGLAAGLRQSVVLVTGDLALLHDSNGLLGSATDPYGLFVILLNNNGGGIFELLPAAQQAAFEQVYATAQAIDFSQLVGAHQGIHSRAASTADVHEAWLSWDRRGLRVVEVAIDRKVSAGLHRKFLNP